MELILKSNNEHSIAKIIALAKQLNVTVEQRENIHDNEIDKKVLRDQILNFNSTEPSSYGNPVNWQRQERKDRDLPFNQ